MKRDLLCTDCAEKSYGYMAPERLGEGERVKHVQGTVVPNGLICDQCAAPLRPGAQAVARSIWFTWRGNPYFPWEHDYLKVQR